MKEESEMRVTEEYYSYVIFSASKRAKNARDLEKYSKSFGRIKKEFYNYKNTLLKALTPYKLQMSNEYGKTNYYVLYKLDKRDFHRPILKDEFDELKKELSVEILNESIMSKGCRTNKLCSEEEIKEMCEYVIKNPNFELERRVS